LNTQLGPDLRKFGIYWSKSPLFYSMMQKRLEFNLSLSEEDVKEYLQQVIRR